MHAPAQKDWRSRDPKPAWGKFDNETGAFHRLEHHCADVAACFEVLVGDRVLRRRFEEAAGDAQFDRVTAARLTVLAFLHDFGKVNTGFQASVLKEKTGKPQKVSHIRAVLMACERSEVLRALGIESMLPWGVDGLNEFLRAALAHHGRPVPNRPAGRGSDAAWRPYDNYDPIASAELFAARAREWFPEAFASERTLPAPPALVHLFTGILMIADQLGSNQEFFPYEPEVDPTYYGRARKRACRVVRETGFLRAEWVAEAAPARFGSGADAKGIFDFDTLRPLQLAVREAPLDDPLLILESDTGSGKTEAAVIRFAKLWHAGLVDGLYFALPTRAAAVQIHRRIHAALARLFPRRAEVETVLAIPGYLTVGDTVGNRVGRFDVHWKDDADERTRRARWSAEGARKFLSATAAVGTVDQALLGALKVKWAHFRGASLARSLLVVDEVHASDAYMIEVLRGLLRAHLAVGGHALLMSATLGAVARDELAKNAIPRIRRLDAEEAKSYPYPALTLARRDGSSTIRSFDSTGYRKSVHMSVEPIMGRSDRIADRAVAEARSGGKVLVVLNTVGEAQAIFEEVLSQGAGQLCLQVRGVPAVHHSRFAAEDRKLLDLAVEEALGRDCVPQGRIVIGTQTLEQSLDIDADVLITSLCPVDVLLQRIGRLHRHQTRRRPDGFAPPRCVVLQPEEGLEPGLRGGLLRHGLGASRQGKGIYRDLRVLELTRRLVDERPEWTIPDMNRTLVEEATHPDSTRALEQELGGAWKEQALNTLGRRAAERQVAKAHRLDRSLRLEELEFPGADEAVRTRLGDDGPRIKLAERIEGPFGQLVGTFNLPAHMFRGAEMPTREEIEAATLCRSGPETFQLRVGPCTFRYGRIGIRQAQA